jgi:photosystem II stability/assembly factor-like uncharacterized protein
MTHLQSILFLFLLIPFGISAQNSSLVYPVFDQYENFQDVYIAPEGRGYAVGSCNTLYLTTNDGDSWARKDAPQDANQVLDVLCAPGTNCAQVYLSTNRGTYRSTNGGNNWTLVHNRQMPQMDFSQPNVIHSYRPNAQEFYRSTDDGLSWATIPVPDQIKDEMHFTSLTLFAMIGDSAFYRSVDAGVNWTKTYQFPDRAVLTTTDDDDNYYVETNTRGIYKSEDGGISWTQKAENAHQYTSFYDMYKDAEDSLHVISFNGVRFSSADDGVTWGRNAPTRFRRYNSFRRAEGRLFAAGDGLTLLKGNADYTDMASLFGESYPEFREIIFHDTNVGYAYGEDGEVFRTTNGGASWQLVSQIADWLAGRLKLAPNGDLYGMTAITTFGRSTDQGSNWTDLDAANQALEGGRRVFDVLPNGEVVAMTNQRTVRLDANGNVLFAEDGGHQSTSGGTFDLKMINKDLGFIIRWARLDIYRTEDGGITWDTIPAFGGNNFFNWFEVEDDNNFAIGNGSSSWHTTDAGLTWAELDAQTALGRFTVGDDIYGFNRTTLFRSRDDGANWENKFSTCSQPLDMVRRPGTNEVFLTYQNGIERLDIDEILSSNRQPRPAAISLRAVPNPTNGMVTISVPESNTNGGVADLFDLTGRRMNVPASTDSGQLQVDLSSLKSGYYLLRYTSPTGQLFQAKLIRQ